MLPIVEETPITNDAKCFPHAAPNSVQMQQLF